MFHRQPFCIDFCIRVQGQFQLKQMSQDFPISYKRILKRYEFRLEDTEEMYGRKCDENKLAFSEVGSGDRGGWHNPCLRGV